MIIMIKPKEMAERLGITVKTLQNWNNNGILKAHRAPTNRRFYTDEQYLNYIHKDTNQAIRKRVAYARVSHSGKKDDLKNPIEFLREYANGAGLIIDEVMTDIVSGLNYKRKHWNELLDEVMTGNIESIYVTYKDRFVRFG